MLKITERSRAPGDHDKYRKKKASAKPACAHILHRLCAELVGMELDPTSQIRPAGTLAGCRGPLQHLLEDLHTLKSSVKWRPFFVPLSAPEWQAVAITSCGWRNMGLKKSMVPEDEIDADTCFNVRGPAKAEGYVRMLWSCFDCLSRQILQWFSKREEKKNVKGETGVVYLVGGETLGRSHLHLK